MKIVGKKKPKNKIVITVRVSEDLLKLVDGQRREIKREPFIRAILEQVLNDPKFVLKLDE